MISFNKDAQKADAMRSHFVTASKRNVHFLTPLPNTARSLVPLAGGGG